MQADFSTWAGIGRDESPAQEVPLVLPIERADDVETALGAETAGAEALTDIDVPDLAIGTVGGVDRETVTAGLVPGEDIHTPGRGPVLGTGGPEVETVVPGAGTASPKRYWMKRKLRMLPLRPSRTRASLKTIIWTRTPGNSNSTWRCNGGGSVSKSGVRHEKKLRRRL